MQNGQENAWEKYKYMRKSEWEKQSEGRLEISQTNKSLSDFFGFLPQLIQNEGKKMLGTLRYVAFLSNMQRRQQRSMTSSGWEGNPSPIWAEGFNFVRVHNTFWMSTGWICSLKKSLQMPILLGTHRKKRKKNKGRKFITLKILFMWEQLKMLRDKYLVLLLPRGDTLLHC